MRRLEIYVVLAVLGIVFLPLSFSSLYLEDTPLARPLQDAGNWNYWIMFLSALSLLYGGYYSVTYIRKRREFFSILNSGSKAKIAKNAKKLREDALWLGRKYVDFLEEKFRELKIR